MFRLVRFPFVLLLFSCDNRKDHRADCGEILECSDGSFDYDGDGYCENDCNDESCDVNPGAPEVCDGVDNDCDGKIDAFDRDIKGDDDYEIIDFYVDKDLDGSPSDDKQGVCVRTREHSGDWYRCEDIQFASSYASTCVILVDSPDRTTYISVCDEDEEHLLFCGADADNLKEYSEKYRSGDDFSAYKEGFFDCCDKSSDLGCERGTDPICQYPVETDFDVYECGPDADCVPYRTQLYTLP